MTWADVRKELDRLATLTDGWDGEGGPAPHPNAVAWLWVVWAGLEAMNREPPDRVHVGVNGSIFSEWNGADRYLELETFHDPRRGVVVETREVGRRADWTATNLPH